MAKSRPSPASERARRRERETAKHRAPRGVFIVLLIALLATAVTLQVAHRRATPVQSAIGNPQSTIRNPQSAIPDAPSTEAQSLLAAAAGARPGDPEPARRLGDFYAGAGRPFEALWAFATALHARPEDTPTMLGVGRALEAALLYDRSIGYLTQILAREPANRGARAALVELDLRTGRPEAAREVLESGSAEERMTAPVSETEGRVHEALHDLAGAERAYRRATALDPSDASAWHRLGLLSLAQGGSIRAGTRSEGADRGSPAAARQALERARALDPNEPRYAVDVGRAIAVGGSAEDLEAAMRLFREVATARPDASAFYEAGRILARQGQLTRATNALLRATTADPNFAPAYEELAAVLDRAGRRADAHYHHGLFFSMKDLRVRALREYLAMAAADPSRPTGLLMASQSRFKMQQNASALEVARRARSRFPRDHEVREQLAALAIVASRRDEATALCREWLQEDAGAPRPLWMLGRIAADTLRFDESFRYYQQALGKQPNNPAFLQSYGQALLDAPGNEHVARAVEVLARAATTAPDDAKSRHLLGTALMRAVRPEEALRQMLRSLDLDPNHGPTYSTLVQLGRRLRQPGPVALFAPLVREVEDRLREELVLWRHTWDHPDDPEGYLALAQFLIRHRDLIKAESQLEEGLRLRPHWPEAGSLLVRVRRLLAVTE